MATVHVGRLHGAAGFARRVAIKRLHSQLALEPEIAAAFVNEARLSARIAHANVVPVLDVVYADGELLLVMDYVHGETLSRLLTETRVAGAHVSVPIVVTILADVLYGLHAAHEATDENGDPLGIVHRDVSPQNVIVGADGVARVVDFGIAKALGSAPMTRDGQTKGKMAYMAPEQLLRRTVDRRADVYAAGVTLWEALAGRRLFQATEEPALFGEILEEPVPPPSHTNPEVSEALDEITLRALARDPDRRFDTARDMALALEGVMARAAPSTIADWVATMAREALAERAARIAEMEREPSANMRADARAVRAPSASVMFYDATPARGAVTGPPVATATPSAPAPRSDASHDLTPSSARGGIFLDRKLGLVGGALVLAGVLMGLLVYFRHPSTSISTSSAILPSSTVDIASAMPEPIPTASAPAPPPPPPPSIAPAAPVPARVPAPHAKLVSTRPTSAPQGTKKWCKILDPDKGVFVVKEMRVARCP